MATRTTAKKSDPPAAPVTPAEVLEAAREAVREVAPDDAKVMGADPFQVLHAYLGLAKDRNSFRAALSFIAPAARALPEDERDELRDKASVMLASFSNRIDTKALDGKHVTITKARYLDTKFGGTYLLTGKFVHAPGDLSSSDSEWECWMPGTENGPVFRFFARRRKDQYPVDVIFTNHKITRKDGEPGTMWQVERVADEPEAFKEVPW